MSINITNKVMRERMAHIAQKNEEFVSKRDELLASLTISKEFLDELYAISQWSKASEPRDEWLSDVDAVTRVLKMCSRAIGAMNEKTIKALRKKKLGF